MSERVGNSRRAGIKYLLQFFLKTARQAIKSGKLDAEDMKYAKRAVDAIMEHRGPFTELLRFIDEKFPTWLDRYIVNLLLAAFDIGKSCNVTKSARDHVFKELQSDRGRNSGKKRAEEAAETWHPETKNLVEQKRKSDPTARKKAEFIRYVRDNWPLAQCVLPKSDRQIDRFISTLEPFAK